MYLTVDRYRGIRYSVARVLDDTGLGPWDL